MAQQRGVEPLGLVDIGQVAGAGDHFEHRARDAGLQVLHGGR